MSNQVAPTSVQTHTWPQTEHQHPRASRFFGVRENGFWPGGRRLRAIFRAFDTDKNGFVSLDEFRQGLRIFGFNVDKNNAAFKRLIRNFDGDGSGSIDEAEFLRIFRTLNREQLRERLQDEASRATGAATSGSESPRLDEEDDSRRTFIQVGLFDASGFRTRNVTPRQLLELLSQRLGQGRSSIISPSEQKEVAAGLIHATSTSGVHIGQTEETAATRTTTATMTHPFAATSSSDSTTADEGARAEAGAGSSPSAGLGFGIASAAERLLRPLTWIDVVIDKDKQKGAFLPLLAEMLQLPRAALEDALEEDTMPSAEVHELDGRETLQLTLSSIALHLSPGLRPEDEHKRSGSSCLRCRRSCCSLPGWLIPSGGTQPVQFSHHTVSVMLPLSLPVVLTIRTRSGQHDLDEGLFSEWAEDVASRSTGSHAESLYRVSQGLLLVELAEHVLNSNWEAIDGLSDAIKLMSSRLHAGIVSARFSSKLTLLSEAVDQLERIMQKMQSTFQELVPDASTVAAHQQQQHQGTGPTMDVRSAARQILGDDETELKEVERSLTRYLNAVVESRGKCGNIRDLHKTQQEEANSRTLSLLALLTALLAPVQIVTGVYGMNFKNMPELEYENSYFIAAGLIGTWLFGVVVWFAMLVNRRK